MPKVSPIQNNFNGGELSPLLAGRVDFDQYRTSLKTCENFIPLVQGGLTRRPGTYFAAAVKTSTLKTRLVPFEFSTTQAYILEFGDQYIRFYMNNGRIEVAGVPVEVVTPYVEADLFQLRFTQSADVLYIVHPSYKPRTLTRTSHTSWTLANFAALDGPYLPTNILATTLTPSATTGTITITASVSVFSPTDVGRFVRIKHGTTWGYATITVYTDTQTVTAECATAFGATTASAFWRLGLWSDTTGYPAAVTFFEDRLWFGGAPRAPQRIDGSRTGNTLTSHRRKRTAR
jgi:hypothetical protein